MEVGFRPPLTYTEAWVDQVKRLQWSGGAMKGKFDWNSRLAFWMPCELEDGTDTYMLFPVVMFNEECDPCCNLMSGELEYCDSSDSQGYVVVTSKKAWKKLLKKNSASKKMARKNYERWEKNNKHLGEAS